MGPIAARVSIRRYARWRLWPACAALFVVGCRSASPPLPNAKPLMRLQSTTFAAGKPIPARCTADGADVSPELRWEASPRGTESFAIILEDPDAPGASPFVHWVLFNIPATVTSCAEGATPEGARIGRNDAGTTGYYGPKPPTGTHHYVFRVYALNAMLDLPNGATEPELVRAMAGHDLAMGELVGLYSR
ncbi:MAG: YbhB/YbcL family Raf kinase inhibitor-like protein [Fimbriimonadaceae bacterium]